MSYREQVEARVQRLGHLYPAWLEYQQEKSAIKSEANRQLKNRLEQSRKRLAEKILVAVEPEEFKVADAAKAMGVSRQTVDTLLKALKE